MRSSILSPFTLFISVALLFGTTTTAFALPDALPDKEKFINAGQNEYVDPSKKDIYDKKYTEVTFEDGTSLKDIEQIQKVAPIFKSNGKQKAKFQVNTGQTDQNGNAQLDTLQAEDTMKEFRSQYKQKLNRASSQGRFGNNGKAEIKSYSFFSDQHPKNVKRLKVLSGNDHDISQEKTEKLKNQLQQQREKKNVPSKQTIQNTVKHVVTSDNKELMDTLYPSKENINALNEEIKKERKAIWKHKQKGDIPESEYHGDKSKKNHRDTSLKEQVTSFLSSPFTQTAQAINLNNAKHHKVIYMRSDINMNVDLPGNGWYEGNELQLWPRNSTKAQKFHFVDSKNQIRPSKWSDLCFGVQWDSYYNGAKVELQSCDNAKGQNWELRPDGTIRPLGNRWFCLDASEGIKKGSTLQLWECYGGRRQQFQVGDDDFENTHYMRIHATDRELLEGYLGHVLISVGKQDWNGKAHWATNAFSNWGKTKKDKGQNPIDNWADNYDGKTNNIRTNTTINVDRNTDWEFAIDPESARGDRKYADKSVFLPKQKYDEVKYMNGYYNVPWHREYNNDRWPYKDDIDEYEMPGYDGGDEWFVCSTYSRDLWHTYTGEWITDFNGAHSPKQIRKAL